MNVKMMIEWLQELPDDYEMCFSQYTSLVVNQDSTGDEYFMVLDDPIRGIVVNEDNKEIRFFTVSSEERVIKQIENGKEWRELE